MYVYTFIFVYLCSFFTADCSNGSQKHKEAHPNSLPGYTGHIGELFPSISPSHLSYLATLHCTPFCFLPSASNKAFPPIRSTYPNHLKTFYSVLSLNSSLSPTLRSTTSSLTYRLGVQNRPSLFPSFMFLFSI